ncbi:MAG: hypothetical protein LQ343_004352 [Gyalolechia ehrenbergii]|nr:MAG: hypothetical protein LQ343_004352 [Gyalolechia ehrenbergii]
MARIQIPLDALTSRLNLGSRFEGVRSQSLSTRFANLRPISEFLNLSRLSKPAGFGEVQSRVNYNLGYFSSNYVAVAIMLLIYSLLTNLTLLFDIIFVGLGLFCIKKLDGRDLELGFARATTSQLYTGLFVIAVPLFIWANPIGSALWLVGATGERYFEELDSDDDDGQGVTLDGTYFGDELHFTGADLGAYSRSRRRHGQGYGYDSDSSGDGEARAGPSAGTMQAALRNKEDLLLQQALERIRRAQILGQRDVKLTQPEIDALKRKRRQDESRRTRVGSGSKQVDRRRSSNQLRLTEKDSKSGRRKSSGLSPTLERTCAPEGRGATPPGMIVPGPDGRPMHTPIGYYPPIAKQPSGSQGPWSGSRSGSSSSLQQSTPPLPSSQYWSGQLRYSSESDYPSTSPASPLMRRLPDDPHWNPRPRSTSSNHQYPLEPQYHQAYSSPPPPHNSSHYGQGRRIVSGPAEVQYPSISRRPLPMSSVHAASSDPSLPRMVQGGERDLDDSASADETEDEDEEYGVQVDPLPNDHEYEVRRGAQMRADVRPRRIQR